MTFVPGKVASHIGRFADVPGKPGWKHHGSLTPNTRDYWYWVPGSTREQVEQQVANATFAGRNGVQMQALFKRALAVAGVGGQVVNMGEFLGWVQVFTTSEMNSWGNAMDAICPPEWTEDE